MFYESYQNVFILGLSSPSGVILNMTLYKYVADLQFQSAQLFFL